MIPFKILNIKEIESIILSEKRTLQNFSKTISFPFPEYYKNMVTKIKTTEISSETILYGSVEASNENKEFELVDYWCFAGNGQGDRWFLNTGNDVFFYNHDYDEGLEPMDINFEQWLQMAFIIQQLDKFFDEYDTVPESVKRLFYKALGTIQLGLSEKYPFAI